MLYPAELSVRGRIHSVFSAGAQAGIYGNMIHDDDDVADDRITSVRIGYDEKQFRFGFVKTSPNGDENDDGREVFIGHCSPHHAKDIISRLQKGIDAFVKEHGPIVSPREAEEKIRAAAKKAADARRVTAISVAVAAVCVLLAALTFFGGEPAREGERRAVHAGIASGNAPKIPVGSAGR